MPSLLDRIPKLIYRAAKGRFQKGTLRRMVPVGVLDSSGDPGALTPTSWKCQGFVDEYDDEFRTANKIPLTDVKVCIFSASLKSGVQPMKDDKASMKLRGVTTWYQIRGPIRTDPSKALWECQGYVIAAPLESV